MMDRFPLKLTDNGMFIKGMVKTVFKSVYKIKSKQNISVHRMHSYE